MKPHCCSLSVPHVASLPEGPAGSPPEANQDSVHFCSLLGHPLLLPAHLPQLSTFLICFLSCLLFLSQSMLQRAVKVAFLKRKSFVGTRECPCLESSPGSSLHLERESLALLSRALRGWSLLHLRPHLVAPAHPHTAPSTLHWPSYSPTECNYKMDRMHRAPRGKLKSKQQAAWRRLEVPVS